LLTHHQSSDKHLTTQAGNQFSGCPLFFASLHPAHPHVWERRKARLRKKNCFFYVFFLLKFFFTFKETNKFFSLSFIRNFVPLQYGIRNADGFLPHRPNYSS